MFRTKKEVDRHVQDLFRKVKDDKERNLRCYHIAKLYYQVGDYESAKKYASIYLEVREACGGAHKVLGQSLEALGQKEAALTQYKISLELEPRQDDLVLKVCELLADMDVNMDANTVRYWIERADKQFPHHPIVFQLKEKMLMVERPNDNSEDLEALFASELSARPTDVNVRVDLIKHYIAKQRLDDAYNHVAGVEATHTHRNSIVWYQLLSELLGKCKENKQSDWNFWIFYISVLERYAALCLKEQGNEVRKTVQEARQAVFNFDQSLTECKEKNFSNDPAFIENMFLHMWGQLHFHLACLLLRSTIREQGSWSEAGRLCAPLLLSALHVTPIDPTAAWAVRLKDQLKNQVRLWYREGSYRCSQAGHVLQDYARDNSKKLIDKIDKLCTGPWRDRIYQRFFVGLLYSKHKGTSYFANHTAPNPPLRLCSHSELKRYDEVSEEVWPDSLHHQIWLGLKSRPHNSHNKDSGPRWNQVSHVFPELQFSVYNLNQAAPDSLNRLDIDAFLNAAIFCVAAVEQQQPSGFLTPERLPTLPADLTSTLCTCAQEKWWSSAYKMYSKQAASGGDLGEIRQELQRGLEVVRCIGNHGLHPALIVHLARVFHHRVKMLKEKDKQHCDITALEARCEIYWSSAIPLLERLQNNQMIRVTGSKLFNYQGKELNNAELTKALEEGKLLLAQRFVRDKQYEQAIEALQALKCPEASFQQGQIYKILADEIVSSMPRESLTSEMRSQHIIMFFKARDCFYLTLDRLRSPGSDPKHPLNSELCTHITDIENELKRIDPDSTKGDASRNECDGMSDESFSSAHSGFEPITNAPLPTVTGLNTSINMYNTSQRNAHRGPKQSSTPRRPQHADVLDLTRNRTEARPSPERLDAQIRQMLHSKDNTMQTIIEQNKALLESNKIVMEKIEELAKEVADLRKDSLRQRAQSINVNPTLEEDLYVLSEDDYNEINYTANQSGPTSSISGNVFTSSHRHPYSPLVYPSAATAFPGYYQGVPLCDPNAQTLPSLYAQNVYPMPVLYPNRSKMPENILQQGLFTQRLPTQLPDFMPPANPPLQIPLQKVETPKVEPSLKDVPSTKVPPVNVVITTSDTLPTTVPAVQPTLSVTIPPQYRWGGVSTPATMEQPNVPHCYQISMPSQATIPTTVNLPPLSTTLTTTPANISISEIPKTNNINVCATASPNNSTTEVCEPEHDPIPDFVPVIPLPAEVKVTTGEEDEETLYCARAKLFRFVDKEWKERGVGNVKLLKNTEGRVRLLMRRDQVLKICANHMLTPDMELTVMPNNEKAWMWVANDFADEQVRLEKLCIRFKTAEEGLSFKEHFDKAKISSPDYSEKLSNTNEISKDQLKSIEQITAKPVVQNQSVETVSTTQNASLDKSKNSTTAAVVGGFSFASKPIIQKVTTESTKAAQKSDEAPKVSPFAGFTFEKPVTTKESSAAAAQENITTVSSASNFSFVKPPAATQSDTTPSTTVFPSNVSGIPNSGDVANSTLRRPHVPSPAALTSNIGIQNTEANTQTKNEETLFEGKTSLQYYNNDTKQWQNKSTGQMKILCDSKSGKVRLLMVEEGTMKVCYNYNVLAKMSFKTGSNNTVNWSIQSGKKENKTVSFSATFKSADQALQFSNTISNNQKKMVKDCVPVDTVKKQETKKPPPLSELFKPPAGSWDCSACYLRNGASAVKCASCETPNPSASNKQASIPTTVPNEVPLSQMFKNLVGSWECQACYIVNTSTNDYCVACDSPKDPSMPPKPKTNSFQLGASTTGATPKFSFGIPQEASKEASGEFTFRFFGSDGKASTEPAKSAIPAASESSNQPDTTSTTFVFGTQQRPATPPNKDPPFTFGSPGKSFGFNFAPKSPVNPPEAGENSEEEVVESDDIHFSPVIPLPDKIDVKTGEEDEDVLYSHRAKLFRYDPTVKEWKERGLGDIKLLIHNETGKLRLIMRRDQTLKLCLNHLVSPDLEFTPKDEKTWLWNAADYSEGEIEPMNFACRFKTREVAESFKQAIDDALTNGNTSGRKADARSSTTEDIEVVYEATVTPEEKAAALKLQLPENFYAYKQKPDCPGCRGCREEFDEKSTVHSAAVVNANTTSDIKTSVRTSGADVSALNAGSSFYTNRFSAASTLGQFTQSPLSTQTGFDSSAMLFGNNDSNVSNDKKTTGFSFGVPQTQLSSNENEKSADKQNASLIENLKICTPTSSQPQQTAIVQSPFTATPTTADAPVSIFSGTTFKSENPFNLNAGMNIFGGASKKDSAKLIKPSSFTISNSPTASTNSFGTPPKTTASATTTTSIFGASPNPLIFGGTATKTNSEATDATVTSPLAPQNSTSTGTFGISAKPANPVFANTSKPFSFSFGTDRTNASPFENSNNTTNVFETKSAENPQQKDGGISFLSTSNVTFSTLAAKAPQQEAFQVDPNFSFAGTGSSVFGSKQSNMQLKKEETAAKKQNENEEDGDDNENDQEHDPHYEPIIPLPDIVEVHTGEEDEEKVFCERAKLYRFDKTTREWKERGVGEMKILHHKEHGTYRLLMRREQVHKVVCNFLLTVQTEFRLLPTSESAWIWGGMNYAEEQPSAEELAVRFKNQTLGAAFKAAIDKAQQSLRETRAKGVDVRGEEDEQDNDEDEDEDDIDEDCEEEDDGDDQNSWLFEKRATLFAKTNKEPMWELVALGNLIIYYDSNIFGEKIILKADQTDEVVSKTVICMDTQMQVEGKECIWTAIDTAAEPPSRRTLKAVFSSVQAAQQMYKCFQDGVDCAKQIGMCELVPDE